jgi:hypothetical protein
MSARSRSRALAACSLLLGLIGGWTSSCATSTHIDDEGTGGTTFGDGSVSGQGGITTPSATTTGTTPIPTTSSTTPTPTTSSTSPTPSGTSPSSGDLDGSIESGPPQNACDPGLKSCGGLCLPPSPEIGCSPNDCTPCATPNGTGSCNGDVCEITCDQGYTLSSGSCVTDASCQNATQDNAETDVDCGGDLCPPCSTGQACGADSDCAQGPCVSDVCTCIASTCDDVTACGSAVDDGCGGTIDCSSKCTGTDVCFNDACCTPLTCPTDSCAASIDDGCGGTIDCSTNCTGTDICFNSQCCAPLTACPATACGATTSVGCGLTDTLDCTGNCTGSDVCDNGTCCTPYAACPAGACGAATSVGCGLPGTLDCTGNCGGGEVCYNDSCCTPSACTLGGCGFQDDGCGGNACTLCSSGSRCSSDADCASNNCSFEWIGCGLLTSCCQ